MTGGRRLLAMLFAAFDPPQRDLGRLSPTLTPAMPITRLGRSTRAAAGTDPERRSCWSAAATGISTPSAGSRRKRATAISS